MMIPTALLAIHLTFDLGPKPAGSRSSKPPIVTCHKGAVSYKFVGTPGTKFVYAGDSYTLPIEGWIEIVSDPHASDYLLAGNKLPLNVGPLDAFGTRTVSVPMPGGPDAPGAEGSR
jgi:hypothetical protein